MIERTGYFPIPSKEIHPAFRNAPEYSKLPEPTRSRRVKDKLIRCLLEAIDQTKIHDLSPFERKVIAARWISGKTNVEIARERRVNRKIVGNAQMRGLRKLGVFIA